MPAGVPKADIFGVATGAGPLIEEPRMSIWWDSLTSAERVFWGIAITSSMIQILLFAASFIGGHDFDHSPDGAPADSVEGVKLVSLRAIVAFLVGFGWAGGLLLQADFPFATTLGISLATGVVFMLVIFFIMRALMSLRADGTIDFHNAIGSSGSVYVTIPANRAGRGQIEIHIQGRLVTTFAITRDSEPLPPQTPVTVDAVEEGNLLVVSRRA